MPKRFISIFFIIFQISIFSIFARDLEKDESVLKGTLKNGLTYFIKENKFIENKASLRLLVKVGSALETENELGIAHFLEHMVFRGSENFKDFEVIKYLESIGAEFGADTNAYTGFDQTCYKLEVPFKDEDSLLKSFQILKDFAFYANIEEEKVDVERNIVLDELKRSSGPFTRATENHLKIILKDTCYENRLPIGKEDIIKNVKAKDIKNFYKKWYVPSNIAIIAVGDFDKKEIKNVIEDIFSIDEDLNKSSNSDYNVKEGQSISFSLVKDPEITFSNIDLVVKKRPILINNKEDLKKATLSSIFFDVINERFQSISSKEDPEFVHGTIENEFLTNLKLTQLGILVFEDKLLLGFEKALEELQKIRTLGISEDEFQRSISKRKQAFENALKNIDNLENENFIYDYVESFLNGSQIFSKLSLIKTEIEILDELKLNEINLKEVDFSNKDSFSICVTLPDNLDISFEDILNSIEKSKKLNFIKETEIKKDIEECQELKPNFEVEPNIVSKEQIDDTTKIVFENGATFLLKQTDLKKNEVLIRSYALDGLANTDPDFLDSAKISHSYFTNSGICGVDLFKLSKFLENRNSSLNLYLYNNFRAINANTTTDNLEDVLILINRIFTAKNYKDSMWKKTIFYEKENQKFSEKYPNLVIEKKIDEIFSCKSNLFKNIDLNLVDLQKSKDILDTLYSNPKDFIFFIVGDFDLEDLISTLKKYLGSISSDKKKKVKLSKNLKPIGFPKDNTLEIIKAGRDDKSFCTIGFSLNSKSLENSKNRNYLEFVRPIIKDRLINALRFENAKTYSSTNSISYLLYPNLESVNYFISFSGPVDDIENIKDLALKTINDFIENGPTVNEISTSLEITKNDKKESIKYNATIVDSLLKKYLFKEEAEGLEEELSPEVLKEAMQKIFIKDLYKPVIWVPNEK